MTSSAAQGHSAPVASAIVEVVNEWRPEGQLFAAFAIGDMVAVSGLAGSWKVSKIRASGEVTVYGGRGEASARHKFRTVTADRVAPSSPPKSKRPIHKRGG